MKLVRRILGRWPVLVAAIVAAGIVHILTIFALPHIYRSDAFRRVALSLPANSFVILPPARPRSQVLPFQMPDARYAICRFDLVKGPLVVRAQLTEPGWTLSAYSAEGESFYALPASEERRVGLTLLIMPAGDRFLGPLSALRALEQDLSQVAAPGRSGMVVIQAPLKGRSYAADTEAALAKASCQQIEL